MGLVGVKYGLVYSHTYNMGIIKITLQYKKVMPAKMISLWLSEHSGLLGYEARVLSLSLEPI